MNKGMEDVSLPLKKIYSGKVRELFEIDSEKLLLVATDRISAFDFVLPSPIPDKGKILTQLSVFWFEYLQEVIRNHVIESDFEKFPSLLRSCEEIKDRSLIVRKAKRLDIECVVRGYIAGGGWKEYQNEGSICGTKLPGGLKLSDKLPEVLFTPATKAEIGSHDRNISFDEMVDIVGSETANFLREKSIELYKKASKYAEEKGIIIADTKFEFGYFGGEIILIDELLTPDSSRFWERSLYVSGRPQDSLDKQYIRDYLEQIGWNKEPPVPEFSDEVIIRTREKYDQIYKVLTGE